MIDLTTREIAAIEHASGAAGEYLESLGKTDMTTFDESEWMTMIEVIVGAFTEHLRTITDTDIPF